MMKKLLLLLLPLIALAGGGYWFWSLGSVPSSGDFAVELTVQQEGVQVQSPDSNEWHNADSKMRIGKGWKVKTDERGQATVRFFDKGESRLDRNSEMAVSEAAVSGGANTHLNAEVTLAAGRIWSRILRLLDIDSSYRIRTSDVVATVRGTAFDFQKISSGSVLVSVSESAVSLHAPSKPSEQAKVVGEGLVVEYAVSGTSTSERPLTNEERSSGWYMSNEMSDQAFVKEQIDRSIQELKSLGGVRADSPLASIASLSEKMHLALADDPTKNSLLEQYLSRRLYHLIELVAAGKTGLAAQEFTRIENDLQAQFEAKDAKTDADYVRASLMRIALLTDRANPSDALYPFKQRIERLFESLSSSSEASKLYARLLGFESRLDEVVRLLGSASLDDARIALDGVKSGLQNVRRDSAGLITSITPEYRSALEGKMSALEIRQQILRTKLDAALHPMIIPPVAATSTESNTSATSTNVITTGDEIVSIRVVATPAKLQIGQRAKMAVKGKLENGTEKDLTAFSSFVSMQYAGKLNGPSYVATAVGKDEVIGQYRTLSGQMLEAKVSVEVTGEVKLVDLVITSAQGMTIDPGEKTVLTATARYNNGQTKNVTDQTVFAVVSGAGDLQSNLFSSISVGKAVIVGTYKDGEVTSIGSLNVEIK